MTRLFFVLFLAISLNYACQNSSNTNNTHTAVQLANTTDPVCGMSIDSTSTETAQYEGKTYGFCSASCKDDFLKDPAKYLTAK